VKHDYHVRGRNPVFDRLLEMAGRCRLQISRGSLRGRMALVRARRGQSQLA
jgi:hypothetical protein